MIETKESTRGIQVELVRTGVHCPELKIVPKRNGFPLCVLSEL
jgi:hypothetical protein